MLIKQVFIQKITSLYIQAELLLDSLKQDQRGVTAIEYALVAVAIAAVVGAVFTADGTDSLKGALKSAMQKIADQVKGASS